MLRSLASFSVADASQVHKQIGMGCPETWTLQIHTKWLSFLSCLSSQNTWGPAPIRRIHSGSVVQKNKPTSGKSPQVNVPLVEQSVQLLGTDGEDMGVMNKKEAYRIADRQELKLMEIQGVEAEVPVYK